MPLSTQDEVLDLVQELATANGQPCPQGASEEQITAFARRHCLEIPKELHEWLSQCNGPNIDPGGICGIGPGRRWNDLDEAFARFPNWSKRGWIPIAGDGGGGYYVLDILSRVSETHPVYYIDPDDRENPAFVVASGLWPFLKFWLHEVGSEEEGDWPFERDMVLGQDPSLRQYQGDVPFPWDSDG